jgi:hypothetical protein
MDIQTSKIELVKLILNTNDHALIEKPILSLSLNQMRKPSSLKTK